MHRCDARSEQDRPAMRCELPPTLTAHHNPKSPTGASTYDHAGFDPSTSRTWRWIVRPEQKANLR